MFRTFAESLKLPLMQIARATELAHNQGSTDDLAQVMMTADGLNLLIENYLLCLNMQGEQQLQPVSLGAVLQEVAHTLDAKARAEQCDLHIHIAGKYEPILAHPLGLQAALVSIGQVLIDARSQQPATTRRVVTLAAHRTRGGIAAGLFSDVQGLNQATFRRAQSLHGRVKEPFNQLVSNGSAGVFIASTLLAHMSGGLRSARYLKQNGLAATFSTSQQLALLT